MTAWSSCAAYRLSLGNTRQQRVSAFTPERSNRDHRCTGRFARGCRGIGGKKISLGASVEAFSFVPMQGHVQDDLTFATQPALLRVGPFRRLDSLYLFGLRCFRRPPTEVVLSALHRAGFTSAQSTGERNSCGKTCTDRPASTGTCMHPKGVIPQFRRRNRTF